MLVHACEQLDTLCVCVYFKRALNLYFQLLLSWGATALGGGWGSAALVGREDQRRQEVRMQGEGAGHGQFPRRPRL